MHASFWCIISCFMNKWHVQNGGKLKIRNARLGGSLVIIINGTDINQYALNCYLLNFHESSMPIHALSENNEADSTMLCEFSCSQ